MATPVRREMPSLGPLVTETIRATIPVTARTMPGTFGPIAGSFPRVTPVSTQRTQSGSACGADTPVTRAVPAVGRRSASKNEQVVADGEGGHDADVRHEPDPWFVAEERHIDSHDDADHDHCHREAARRPAHEGIMPSHPGGLCTGVPIWTDPVARNLARGFLLGEGARTMIL